MSEFGFQTASPPNGGAIVPGVTPIIGGAVGQILFQGAGNVIQESSNLFWDNTNGRFAAGTNNPLAVSHFAGSVTASSTIARNVFINGTLTAAANNDVLVGLDITPVFTVNTSFVNTSTSLRINANYAPPSFSVNNNQYGIDISPTFRDSNISIGLRINPNFVNVSSAGGWALSIENTSFGAIRQTSTSTPNIFAGVTSIGANANGNSGFALNVANAGIKVGTVNSTGQHLVITHSESGATFSSIRSQFSSSAAQMLIDVASQGNLRLFGTGNVGVKTTIDSGITFDVNGTGNFEGNLRLGVGFQLLFNNNNVGLYREANTLKLGGFGGIELTSSATNITAQSIRMKIFDTGNVAINSTVDAGFKFDVNGTIRTSGIIYAGIFIPGAGLQSTDFIATNGRIRATGGISFRPPSSGDNITIGVFPDGGSGQSGVDIFCGGNRSANFSWLGNSVGNAFSIIQSLTTNASSGAINLLNLSPFINASVVNTVIYTGILYNPNISNLNGATHRAIHTVHGDILLGTTSGSVGIGANTSLNVSAILDITSTTQGFLPPRMTTTQKNAIASPTRGLIVFDTSLNKLCVYTTAWETVTSL